MTSEQRRQESENFWFRSPTARNVLEEFVPTREEEETILTDEGQEPEPVILTPTTNIEDVVRNAPGPLPEIEEETTEEDPWASVEMRELVASKLKDAGIERIGTVGLVPEEERSLAGEAGAGVARGIDQTQAMGFGLLGLMGEVLEVEGLSDLGVEGYKRNMEEAAKNMASVQDPFEEIGGVGDAALYATGVLSEQLPQLMLSLLGGGVGGVAAKTVAKKVIANEIGKRVTAGMAKEEAEKVVAKLVAQRALQGFDVPMVRGGVERVASGIGQEAMQQATKAGALGGAYVANVGQIAGGSFGEIEQETGLRDPVNALGFALVGGALETAGEAVMAAPIARKLIGSAARGVEGKALGFNVGPGARVAGQLTGSSAAEGGTEYVQTGLEQAAVASADPNRTFQEVVLTPEAERERQLAATAGAVAGGGMGAASQAASFLIPETSRRVNEVLQRRQQQQGQEEQPPAGVLTGDWSQPVDVGGIKMQRSSTGTWAALNPPEDLDPAAPRNQLPDGTNVVVLRAAAGENNAWLINEAESALSDLSEGKFEEAPPEQQTQNEQEIDEEDQLDTPAELRELEEGLGINVPVKSAEESARTIDDAYTEEERKRESPFYLRYLERRLRLDASQKEKEKAQQERMLNWSRVISRQPDESKAFVDGLVKGESVVGIAQGDVSPDGEGLKVSNGVFAGRRNNGNAVFFVSETGSPRTGFPLGPTRRIELKPSEFNRVYLAQTDPEVRPLVSPFEEAMRDLVGDNPSKQAVEQALGSPFTGKGAPQETTIRNRVGGGPIPVQVRWFNKKGEKGTVIPTFKGKFTNSPLTTVFQMNEGLEVVVPDEQLTDLSPDIQVEAVSDKKGGRKNIVTAVNLWGRTYRRGKTPSDFSVDRPLTSKGSKSRKQGLWLFDDIYRNAPERIEASEAARQGAVTRQGGPLEEQLRRVSGNIEKLDSVENTFYQDDFERATDFLENSNLNEEEKRLAQKMAQDKIVLAYEKIARSSRGAPFRAEGREQIAKRLTEVLAELRAEALAEAKDKALDSIYGDVRGAREIRSAQTRVNRLTGKALGSVRQQSPERSLEKLGTAQRSLAKTPNETQKQAFEDLENFLEGQALSGQSREKIEKGILDRIEKGTNAMLNKAKSRLEKELTQGLKGREKGDVVRAINQVADRYRRLKNFNPIGIATRAAFSAKRSIRRDAANAPIEPRANLEQVLQAPPPQVIGQREQAGDTQTGTGERTEDSPFEVLAKKEEEGQGKPANTIEDGQERFTRLSNEDIDLILRSRGMLENERGGQIKGQISTLTSAQKKRAKQITNYLIGKIPYETLYPESADRGGDAGAVVADADAGQRRTGEVLSGATQSVARRAANPNPTRGSDRVGGRNQGAAGTVQESAVQRDGGSGVPAPLDPQTVRERARAATRRFVQSFARLTDAEAAARSDVEIERARQAILNERDPAEAVANRVAISSTAASVADLASRSNADLLRGAAAEIAREKADRDAVNTARENLGALLRSGAFADANSFIDSVASNTRLPRDMAIRAKEFAKLARRGIDFNNVGIQIGRFGADTSWAGYLTGSDGSYNIAINLDAVHDRDSVVNTMLHELQHVVLKEKIARRIPLNRVEQEALDRLEGIRRDTVVRAARDRGLNVPSQPNDADIARLSEELYQQSLPNVENSDRALASLRNLDEFVVEVSSNPELADLMVRLGFGQGKGQVTMLGALKNAWDSLVQFITGIKADPNSPLAKAFKDSWIVSFANSGADVNLEEYTIPEVRRTAMADELARLTEINAFIDARIQQDNLAGTTEERNRLLTEWSKLNSNPKTAPARKARKKAAKQKKAQADKQAEPEPKPEPPKKAEPKKAAKVETKKETPQKPPEVKKAVKTAQTKTVKPQSPAGSDNEMTQAWQTLSEDDFVKWTKENGYAIGDDPTMARLVYRSNRRTAGLNNNPAPQAQAAPEQATEQQATGDTVQGSESVARSRPLRSTTETTYNGQTYVRPGLFGGENANLDNRAQDLVARLKRFEKSAEREAKAFAAEMDRIIKRVFKNKPIPVNLINDALGNLDNPMTDAQFEEVKRLEQTNPKAAAKKKIAYISENRRKFEVERQAPALLALPEELAGFLREIGAELKKLQLQAIELGIPKGDMAVAFSEQVGIYLTRSYNAFIDQPQWEKNLRREFAELGEQSRMGQFRNTVRATLISQRVDELLNEAMAEGRTLSREQAEQKAREGTLMDEVDQIVENYIAYTREEPSSESFSGLRLPGRQNIKSLTQRKVLSDSLRAFYGQVENPAINFVRSFTKISSLINRHQFQKELLDLGNENGWFWDPEDPRNTGQRPPPGYELIASDNDRSLDVFAGLYANSMLVRGLRESFPPNSLEAAQWWLQPLMKYTGLSMGMKTVGSIAGQVRNYWSSYMVPLAGGNLSIGDILNGTVKKNLQYAHQVGFANLFKNYGNNRKALIDDIRFFYQEGVMGESMTVGLINDLTKLGRDAAISEDKFLTGFEKILKNPGKKTWNAAKQVWEKAEQVYGMTDDIFKIFTYLMELDKYKRAYPNASIDELRRGAAQRARDIHWTYSKSPAIVNELKKFPFIAPFVTFTTETIRITLNIGRLAMQEIKSDNPELQKIGWQRVRGMTTMAVGPWALGTLAMTASGFSGDEEEDLRKFLPDWQKNNQIIILGRNGNEINYADISFFDPFEVWKKPTLALFRGLAQAENAEEIFTGAVVGAALEAARPFTSEQILSGAVMDVMRNRDANGRQVYNPQDSATSIAYAVGKQLAGAFTPGTYDTGVRIAKAFRNQVSETGRDYNFWNEFGGIWVGTRIRGVDTEQALAFKASEFLKARREARSIFNRDYLSRGSRSEADVISAYQRGNTATRDVTEQLRKEYLGAINLGLSPAKARSILRAAGLDRDSARMVSTGIYRRLTPSEEQDRMAAPERKRAARQAIAETPQREVLFP